METKLPVVNAAGQSAGTFELDIAWLEAERGDQAVKDTVVAYLAKMRAGTAKTKNRGEVSGGGAKPWRQKGTGRARAGSNRSPIWRKGGITFGPVPRSYEKKVNRSARRLALKRTFTERVSENAVIVVDSITLAEPKTKQVVAFLNAIGAGQDVLIVVDSLENTNLQLAAGNLPGVDVMRAGAVNPYWLLIFKKIVFTKAALELFSKRLTAEK